MVSADSGDRPSSYEVSMPFQCPPHVNSVLRSILVASKLLEPLMKDVGESLRPRLEPRTFYFMNLLNEVFISEDKIAKLSPSKPFNLNVLIPSTFPERESRGPPLLPGLIVASN